MVVKVDYVRLKFGFFQNHQKTSHYAQLQDGSLAFQQTTLEDLWANYMLQQMTIRRNVLRKRSARKHLPYIYYSGQKNSAVSGTSISSVCEQLLQVNPSVKLMLGTILLYIFLKNAESAEGKF